MSDEDYMRLAIKEAMLAQQADEVPVGAIIVHQGIVIAQTHNMRESCKDPLAHAELLAIREASAMLGGWRLSGCTLYVTLEPCPMFGAYDKKAGAFGTLYHLGEGRLNHKPEVTGGVLEQECSSLLTNYFRNKRK